MNEQHHYIASLCRSLSEQGKKPSIALIRNIATRPLSIPDVIKVLKQWKDDPTTFKNLEAISDIPISAEKKSLEQRVEFLEQQVDQLLKQVASLTP